MFDFLKSLQGKSNDSPKPNPAPPPAQDEAVNWIESDTFPRVDLELPSQPFTFQTIHSCLNNAVDWITDKRNRPKVILIGGIMVLGVVGAIAVATCGAGAVAGGFVFAGLMIKSGSITAGGAIASHWACDAIAGATVAAVGASLLAWKGGFFRRKTPENDFIPKPKGPVYQGT